MKNLRQICATITLTLAFTLPAFADGYITTGKNEPPPPAPTVAADGFITTDRAGQVNTGNGEEPADTVTEITLSLLQSIITLF